MPVNILPAIGIFLLVFFLALATVLGVLSTLITIPVFWRTRYGFVPYGLVASTEDFGEETFLVFVHVLVGTVCYIVAFFGGLVLGTQGLGLWGLGASLLVVTAAAWVVLVAVPMRFVDGPPDRWLSRSLGSFALHAAVFLGLLAGLHFLLGGT